MSQAVLSMKCPIYEMSLSIKCLKKHDLCQVHENIISMRDLSDTNRIPTCLIGERLASLETELIDQEWVSDQACRSPIRRVGLRLVMSVSNGSPIRHVGLQCVSHR